MSIPVIRPLLVPEGNTCSGRLGTDTPNTNILLQQPLPNVYMKANTLARGKQCLSGYSGRLRGVLLERTLLWDQLISFSWVN